jgi:hypothetical protein
MCFRITLTELCLPSMDLLMYLNRLNSLKFAIAICRLKKINIPDAFLQMAYVMCILTSQLT